MNGDDFRRAHGSSLNFFIIDKRCLLRKINGADPERFRSAEDASYIVGRTYVIEINSARQEVRFSARYRDPSALEQEAEQIFTNSLYCRSNIQRRATLINGQSPVEGVFEIKTCQYK